MTLNWRQAITSFLVAAVVVVPLEAGLGGDLTRAIAIAAAIGASRLIEWRRAS